MGNGKQGRSGIRGVYLTRLAARCVIAAAGILALIRDPGWAKILQGWNFFRRFSPFHLLWAAWAADTLAQIAPVGKRLALGSEKLFRFRYIPAADLSRRLPRLPERIRSASRKAYRVFALWTILTIALCFLRRNEILNDAALLCVTLIFYVCDLICVLVWCPFRLMMGNRCCTTCRVFNWDHLMMFSPLIPVRGFFSWSLLTLSAAAFLSWEIRVLYYPERFWEGTNAALRCSNCTDKLCTQYCEGWLKNRDKPGRT